MKRYIRINADDNVGVVLDENGLPEGEGISFGNLSLTLGGLL